MAAAVVAVAVVEEVVVEVAQAEAARAGQMSGWMTGGRHERCCEQQGRCQEYGRSPPHLLCCC